MRIRLTQLDGKLPNLALMRLAAFHRDRGDEVMFTRHAAKDMLEGQYDRVYGSAIFTTSQPEIERLVSDFPGAVVGGTGSNSTAMVEDFTGAWERCDYSLYPDFQPSIGFTARGCRMKCKFCVVPNKEGRPHHANTVRSIWRGEGHPKHLHLLDNDFFGGPHWRERISEIRDGGFKVCLNQGINVRLINEEAAEALASVEYRDDQFHERRLYTAWDNFKNESVFFRGVDRLEKAGIPPRHLMAYMLIGFDPKETWVSDGVRPKEAGLESVPALGRNRPVSSHSV